MTKETTGRKSTKSGNTKKVAIRKRKEGFATVESYLPAGSPQRAVAGIAGAACGALLAAAVLGVGPAALAGAAGYVVYHETGGA
jgi:hypothetical protein